MNNAIDPLTTHEPWFPKCASPYCDGIGCAECGAGAESTPDARVAIANADQVSGTVSSSPRALRSETCEEHLGNALQVIRVAKAEHRQVTLEELAAVLRRINQALTEVTRLNV